MNKIIHNISKLALYFIGLVIFMYGVPLAITTDLEWTITLIIVGIFIFTFQYPSEPPLQ